MGRSSHESSHGTGNTRTHYPGFQRLFFVMAVTLFCYRPSCFSDVNNHVHGLVSRRVPRFAHEKQEVWFASKSTASEASFHQ